MTHDLHHLLNWRVIELKEKNFSICTRQAHLGELWEWHTTCIIFSIEELLEWKRRILPFVQGRLTLENCENDTRPASSSQLQLYILMKRMDYIIQFLSCPSGAWYQLLYVTSPILISILTSLNGGKLCTDFRGFTNSTKHTRWWYEQY